MFSTSRGSALERVELGEPARRDDLGDLLREVGADAGELREIRSVADEVGDAARQSTTRAAFWYARTRKGLAPSISSSSA